MGEGSFWSKIKAVYIELQGGKCGYCERRFSTGEKSSIEHDVEHFRPKSVVKKWPPEGSKLSYRFSTGPASAKGYYLLPYEPLNYLAACKKCNTSFKSTFFPIATDRRKITSSKPEDLAGEKSFLIYPIGDSDANPVKLIAFVGLLPAPVASSGFEANRGRVTIDFFGLALREELLRERAELLKVVFVAFLDRDHKNKARREDARQTIRQLDNPKLKHRNCALSFYMLCQKDEKAAEAHYEAAIKYLTSVDG